MRQKDDKYLKVAFFHPYCNAGGGGERVLWCAIRTLQKKYSLVKIAVYTGDIDASPQDILLKTAQRFNINISDIEFIYLHKRHWVEAFRYPHFTLLGQSIGSMVLAYEALKSFVPDIYIDTMGYAFTLPLFSFFAGCKTVSYVHYPTITTDMIEKVMSRQKSYNNKGFITKNPILTFAKLVYYKIFARMYRFVGRFSDIIMVNSSWTENHINSLWLKPMTTYKVYPPCDTADLQCIPLQRKMNGKIKIVSVAQFRKEKNHPLQLKSMYQLRQLVSEDTWNNLELVLIGSTRNVKDEEWLQDMKDLAKHYTIENNVTFIVNASYTTLKKEFEEGLIGIHTMTNEHFGIGIIECMAAGLIMVAHKSGGPMLDIIEELDTSRNGFLASDEDEYAQVIALVLLLPEEDRNRIREAARSSTNRFSVQEFEANFLRAVEPLFLLKKNS